MGTLTDVCDSRLMSKDPDTWSFIDTLSFRWMNK
jgi:hypothetical protein